MHGPMVARRLSLAMSRHLEDVEMAECVLVGAEFFGGEVKRGDEERSNGVERQCDAVAHRLLDEH